MSQKYIYLILSRTGTLLSRVIGIFTEGRYTHASISFDSKFNRLYSFGRTNPNNPFSGGFAEENLFDGVYRKFTYSQCLIYKIKITDIQYEILKDTVTSFCTKKREYRYNFLGLFGVILNKPIKRQNYYFCSQFVSELLIKSSVYITHKIPELTKPEDLLQITNKELVYEGSIREIYRNTYAPMILSTPSIINFEIGRASCRERV
jgi:hypothetical protein